MNGGAIAESAASFHAVHGFPPVTLLGLSAIGAWHSLCPSRAHWHLMLARHYRERN